MSKRHGVTVTADRLAEAVERWPDRFTLDEVAAAQNLAHRLRQIAAHDRTDTDTGWRCSCGSAVSLPGLDKVTLDALFTDHAAESSTRPGDPE